MKKILIYTIIKNVDLSNKEYSLNDKFKFENYKIIHVQSGKEYLENVPEAEIIICALLNEKILSKTKKLNEKNIILTSLKGAHKIQMTEYAIAMMIIVSRQIHTMLHNSKKKQWLPIMPQSEIFGASLGIIGVGEIGTELAKKANLMGMKVLGVKRTPKKVDFVHSMYTFENINDFYGKCDFIVNLLPSTKQTHQIINLDSFKQMKSSACFINIGRGSSVNEAEMVTALKTK